MKRVVVSLTIVLATIFIILSLHGCVVPYPEGGHRGGDLRGLGPVAHQRIRVVSGTYGGNCGAGYGNVTGHLAAVCDGKQTCEYAIDYLAIGDPAQGCPKDYVAEWQCGNHPKRLVISVGPEAGNGTIIILRCPAR